MEYRTERLPHFSRHSPVSADAIAPELVRNGRYGDVNRESTRFVFLEGSYLWRTTTPSLVGISENFTSKAFTVALQHLKPSKAPGPDSIFPELILRAGSALKSWF